MGSQRVPESHVFVGLNGWRIHSSGGQGRRASVLQPVPPVVQARCEHHRFRNETMACRALFLATPMPVYKVNRKSPTKIPGTRLPPKERCP